MIIATIVSTKNSETMAAARKYMNMTLYQLGLKGKKNKNQLFV
jgi:hypothetical protein